MNQKHAKQKAPIHVENQMRSISSWVLWKYNEHKSKIPYQVNDRKASSTDPGTWSTYDEVSEVQSNFDGLGFVFSRTSNMTFVDMDHVLDSEGNVCKEWAKNLLKELKPGYVEISPSGDGLHCFFEGMLQKGHKNKLHFDDGSALEIYSDARFSTVTGVPFRSSPLIPSSLTTQDIQLLNSMLDSDTATSYAEYEIIPCTKSVDEVIKKLKANKEWPEGYQNPSQQSEEDMSFIHAIARITGPDPDIIEQVWKKSALVRPKTENRMQYHIDRALGYREAKSLLSHKFLPQFPDGVKSESGKVKYFSTFDNLRILINQHLHLDYYYDVILKDVRVIGWDHGNNWKSRLRSYVLSEVQKAELPKSIVDDHFDVVMRSIERNPLMDHIESIAWDGKDRIKKLEKRIGSQTGDKQYRREILTRTLIQTIAAWDGYRRTPNKNALPKAEYVLTLVGGQGVNKTTFFMKLMTGIMQQYFKSGVLIRPPDRDSVKQSTSFGMCELGELDATVRKSDIAEIKAFTSNSYDVYRVAYGRDDEKHLRRTVFVATVNPTKFLKDPTGARRFLILKIDKHIDMDGFDVMQLWAQAFQLYMQGEKWWIEPGDHAYNVQIAVNNDATDGGIVEDVLIAFRERLKSCEESVAKRIAPTKIWEYLMGKSPSSLERSLFIQALEREDNIKYTQKNGISVPKDFIEYD